MPRLFVVLGLVAALGPIGPADAEFELVTKPAKDDPMAVHHYRLANGLVYI